MPPGSPNPDPISDQKNVILHTVFRPGLSEIVSSLLTLECPQKRLLKIHFEVAYIILIPIKTETLNTLIAREGGGGGGTQQRFVSGGCAPSYNPLPFYQLFSLAFIYHFSRRYPFFYTSY